MAAHAEHLAALPVGGRYLYEIDPARLQKESAAIHAIFVRSKALQGKKFSTAGYTAVPAQGMGAPVLYIIAVTRTE